LGNAVSRTSLEAPVLGQFFLGNLPSTACSTAVRPMLYYLFISLIFISLHSSEGF
jgi:hypothetical protein